LACKEAAVTCVETGIREIPNYSSDAMLNQILSALKSSIHEEVECIVRTEQESTEYIQTLNRDLTADKYYGKDEWQQKLEQTAMKILTKQKNEFVEVLKSLSKGITNSFLNNSRQFLRETSKNAADESH
jgi:glutamyl-tRNA reductase